MLENRVREERLKHGWSQEELARRAGLSRAGVSAIETDRLVPSAASALAIAAAFGCRVEDLFFLPKATPARAEWAWQPPRTPCRYWRAEVDGRVLHYPAEASPLGLISHDGIVRSGSETTELDSSETVTVDPRETLVLACCDPAVGLLARELASRANVRLLVLPRSSRAGLELLRAGLVHLAGVHLADERRSDENARAVRETVGQGQGLELVRVASWEEGIALATGLGLASSREVLGAGRVRWVGREPGSGARRCLDEIRGTDCPEPTYNARDHRGVAEAIRSGWADAGVCLRLVAEDANLDFLSVSREAYDLCLPARHRHDPRVLALLNILQSRDFRRQLGELPGYSSAETGQLEPVADQPI